MPKVYYGLTQGAQTYRFIADNVFNVVGLPGEIGSAYELYSSAESDNEYIPAVVVQLDNDQIKVVIQGDYRVNTNTFDAVNTTDGTSTSITLSSPLTLQDASYLGQFNAQDEKSKQITVLNNLETGAKNVVFASIDYNSDGTFNWVEIGGFTNGKDGKSIYSVLSATYSTIVGLVKDGDLLFFAEDVTVGADNYYLGDVYLVDTASPLSLTLQGNIRGPQGATGATGSPGANGQNGDTPYIVSGNWWISGTDTGVRAYGHDGTNGVNGQAFNMQSGFYSTPANYGQPGNDGPEGETLLQLPTLPQPDISGKGYIAYDPLTTPLYPFYDLYYANNGDVSWTIMHPFNGMKGQDGADGETPYIQSGNWYIGGVDTGVPATGSTGATGATGADGVPCLFVAANLSTSTDVTARTSFSPTSFQSRIAIGNTVISQNGLLAKVTAVSTTNVTTTFVKSLIGPAGSTGATGATPNISVSATQLAYGSTPTATRSGTDANPIITFGIPGMTDAEFKTMILNIIYPVGSIKLDISGTNPGDTIGGTWTKISDGYALWTATSGAGTTINAGLPNITGKFIMHNNDTPCYVGCNNESGAFYKTDAANRKVPQSTSAQRSVAYVGFDASRSSSIYSNSVTTVQPPAYKVYAWRRTA